MYKEITSFLTPLVLALCLTSVQDDWRRLCRRVQLQTPRPRAGWTKDGRPARSLRPGGQRRQARACLWGSTWRRSRSPPTACPSQTARVTVCSRQPAPRDPRLRRVDAAAVLRLGRRSAAGGRDLDTSAVARLAPPAPRKLVQRQRHSSSPRRSASATVAAFPRAPSFSAALRRWVFTVVWPTKIV